MQILTTEATDESNDGDGNGTDDNCHCNDDPIREEGFLSVNTIFHLAHSYRLNQGNLYIGWNIQELPGV